MGIYFNLISLKVKNKETQLIEILNGVSKDVLYRSEKRYYKS